MDANTKNSQMTHSTQNPLDAALDLMDGPWQAPRLSSVRNVLAYSRSVEAQPTSVGSPVTHLN